jgi:hypothetical protein
VEVSCFEERTVHLTTSSSCLHQLKSPRKEFAQRTLIAVKKGVERIRESECFKDHHLHEEEQEHEDEATSERRHMAEFEAAAPFMETWILWQ